jgi:hypothetical protein
MISCLVNLSMSLLRVLSKILLMKTRLLQSLTQIPNEVLWFQLCLRVLHTNKIALFTRRRVLEFWLLVY